MKRVIRSRRLTTEEAAEYRAVREQIEQEQPEITARIRRQLAEAECAGNPLLDQHLPSTHEARDLGALPAPAAEVRELTEDDLLDLVRKARRRIWDERYREATETALSEES